MSNDGCIANDSLPQYQLKEIIFKIHFFFREMLGVLGQVDKDACVVCHTLEGDKVNLLKDGGVIFGSLISFCKRFNHTA